MRQPRFSGAIIAIKGSFFTKNRKRGVPPNLFLEFFPFLVALLEIPVYSTYMFAIERINLIQKYLREHQQVDVKTLRELLNVSEVTIRRDLEKLEQEGFLLRTHGGAILTDSVSLVSTRPGTGTTEYSEIGKIASRLIQEGEFILLLAGNLTRQLARFLFQFSQITVLTNDIVIAGEISATQKNRCVILGGEVSGPDQAVYGTLTLDDLERFHVDRVFVEVDGVSRDLDLSVTTQEKALLIRSARQRTGELVILCEAEGFYKNAFFSFGKARSGDIMVTDRHVSDEVKQHLFNANIKLFTTIDIYEGTP
ncbi:MAG: DeoR/GlpR family DNA-binding transcription regulator [Treponemataceae bacterium]|nr:DeoR/GlpR family DNA-binding transcription regulator [Treponemataceae bacterium]